MTEKTVTVRMPVELVNAIKRQAKETDRSFSAVVREAVRAYLKERQ